MSGSGSSRKAHDFLRSIAGFTEANTGPNVEGRPIRLGTVDYDYDPNDFLGGIYPRIMFDGEKVVSQKRYKTMVGYYPLPGHRVVLLPIGTTYLIIGTVSTAPQDQKVDVFATVGSDTWDKPQGARVVVVEVQAGGAGGGGVPSGNTGKSSAAGGGGGGEYAKATILANSIASSVTITVGAGGAGGAAGANAGSVGGDSSFGTLVTAVGGNGGAAGATKNTGDPTTSVSTGGTGGTGGVGGDVIIRGDDGGNGVVVADAIAGSGWGGGSFLGAQRRGSGFVTGAGGGTSGYFYGGGGGGGCSGSASSTAQAGGVGRDGIIIVTTYF